MRHKPAQTLAERLIVLALTVNQPQTAGQLLESTGISPNTLNKASLRLRHANMLVITRIDGRNLYTLPAAQGVR